MEEDFTSGWIASFSPSKCTVYYCGSIKNIILLATGRNKEKERLLANEKSNFKLLAQKVYLSLIVLCVLIYHIL